MSLADDSLAFRRRCRARVGPLPAAASFLAAMGRCRALYKHGTKFSDINHAGVVVYVAGKNLLIAQHDRNVIETLWAAGADAGWFGRGVVAAWAVAPYTGSFDDHTKMVNGHSVDCDDYRPQKDERPDPTAQ